MNSYKFFLYKAKQLIFMKSMVYCALGFDEPDKQCKNWMKLLHLIYYFAFQVDSLELLATIPDTTLFLGLMPTTSEFYVG